MITLMLNIILFITCQTCFAFYSKSLNLRSLTLRNTNIPKSISIEIKKLIKESMMITAISLVSPKLTYGRQGAFEMDMEYYFRNIINGNKGGAIDKTPTPYPSPRKLDEIYSKKILEIVTNSICSLGKVSRDDISKFVNENISAYLKKFSQYVPITNYELTDQYYFDIIIFLHYLYAKNVLKTSIQRVELRELVAKEILNSLKLKSSYENYSIGNYNTTGLSMGIKDILDNLVKIGMIESYSIDDENLTDQDYVKTSFDEGLPVSIQFTLIKPCWMLGWLEFAGPNFDTMFHEEFGASVISEWIKSFGYKISYEDYPFDNFYRIEAVQAQDAIIEMSIRL